MERRVCPEHFLPHISLCYFTHIFSLSEFPKCSRTFRYKSPHLFAFQSQLTRLCNVVVFFFYSTTRIFHCTEKHNIRPAASSIYATALGTCLCKETYCIFTASLCKPNVSRDLWLMDFRQTASLPHKRDTVRMTIIVPNRERYWFKASIGSSRKSYQVTLFAL